MKTRLNNKKIAKTLASVVGVAVLLFVVFFVSNRQNCNGIKISFDDSNGVNFLTQQTVANLLPSHLQNGAVGIELDSLDLTAIEANLDRYPYVDKSEVFLDINGQLNVMVRQKVPLLRVKNAYGDMYYLSDEGEKLALSTEYSHRVPVVSGYLNDSRKLTGMIEKAGEHDLFELGTLISKDEFWSAMVTQINVTADQRYELSTMIGDFIVNLGKIRDMEKKLGSVKGFFQIAMKKTAVDWSNYVEIICEHPDKVRGLRAATVS